MVRVKAEIRAELAKAIQELRTVLDCRVTVQESSITEHQKDLEKSIDSKLAVMENKLRNDPMPGAIGTGINSSWADTVAKEVESKIHEVTADVNVLKQRAEEMQLDKNEYMYQRVTVVKRGRRMIKTELTLYSTKSDVTGFPSLTASVSVCNSLVQLLNQDRSNLSWFLKRKKTSCSTMQKTCRGRKT